MKDLLNLGDIKEELTTPRSPQEFEKYFICKLKCGIERYTYIRRYVKKEDIPFIFSKDLNPDVFLEIVKCVNEIVFDSKSEFNQPDEVEYMREIFLEFVKIPAFKDIFMFFMPDEQTQIKAAFKGASVTID